MPSEIFYNRNAVFNYAKEWAFKRNPKYNNFDKIGGDCTNFASQCIFSGCGIMNYTPVYGWYYLNANNRTAAWSGVTYLYNFLISNKSVGPYGVIINIEELKVGDIVQLGNANNHYYHCPVVVGNNGGEVFVAAHTFDAFYRPLSSYEYANIRCIRIAARK